MIVYEFNAIGKEDQFRAIDQAIRTSPLIFLILAALTVNGCTPQPSISEKSQKIHQEVLTVDSHIDWPIRQMINPDFNPSIRNNPEDLDGGQWDIARMREGGLDAVFMSIYTRQRERTDSGHLQAKKQALQMIQLTQKLIEDHAEQIEGALNPEDAYRLEKAGKSAIFMGMENGYPLGQDINNVQLFYEQGIRYITLTHTLNNELGDSSTDEKQEWNGLSPFGEKVILEMNRLGIMVDISHVHDDTFWDVIQLTRSPIIASHSSARAVHEHPRNMNDEMLKAIQQNGGVVQICILDDYLKELEQTPERQAAVQKLEKEWELLINGKPTLQDIRQFLVKKKAIDQQFPKNQPTVADVVDHIDHLVQVMGIDHVGIGSDFDGGGGVAGLKDVSELPNLTLELIARGYTKEEIRKIWGGNLMRVFAEVQNIASEGNIMSVE